MAYIKVVGVSVWYDSHEALRDVSLEVERGEVAVLIGPNGSGKTTLLKTIDGILKPRAGAVYVDGRGVEKYKGFDLAKRLGYVPQRLERYPMRVADFILTGRRPRIGFRPSRADWEAVDRALRLVDALHLRERPVTALSGGEAQRVLIARALAAEPEALLLDEPTADLDLKYQVEVLSLVRRLAWELRLTVLMTLHDLTQAYRYADKVIAMKGGRIYAVGRPEDVLTPQNIKAVYGVEAAVVKELKAVVPL